MANVTRTRSQGDGSNLARDMGKFELAQTVTTFEVPTDITRLYHYKFSAFGGTANDVDVVNIYSDDTLDGTATGDSFGVTVSGGTVAFNRAGTADGSVTYVYTFEGRS